MQTPNTELEMSQTAAEVDGDADELSYILSEANIDEFFSAFSKVKCTTVEMEFDWIEELEIGFDQSHIDKLETIDELPEVVQYLAVAVKTKKIAEEGKPEITAIVLETVPYMWAEEQHGCFPPNIQIALGRVEDGKVTPSVLNTVRQLNTAFESSVIEFEKL